MSKISMVENAKATACKSVGTRNFVEAVISGKWRDKIKTIRRTYQMTMEQTGGDSKRASAAISELKRKLPAVIWAGEFSKRESKGVKEYSGLMVIDLDHLGTMLTKAKKKLSSDPHVFACFVSPSGNGLKAVYKVPSDIERHADAWATAAKRVQSLTGIKPDHGNDVARLCFASHDPEAYHNPQAVELEIETTPTLEKEKPTLSLQVTAPTALQGLSDSELIEKASNAANGSKFTSLWYGLWQGVYKSQNEADAGLLSLLHFWTSGDKARSFSLFAQSGLSRDKWSNRKDYREATWAKVVNGDKYDPDGTAGKKLYIAEPFELEPPTPYLPFPINALPEPCRSLVSQGAAAIGCDTSLIALPLLAAAAGAIGNARRIKLKRTWKEPAILWAVTVARSGGRKSPGFDLGISGLSEIEDKEWTKYLDSENRYKCDLEQWKMEDGKTERPEPPKLTRKIVREISVEQLAQILSENENGVILARDELAAWAGGFDKYRGGKGEEVAHWLEMHRGGKLTVDRKTGENKHIHVARAAVSITGTIQPRTLERILGRNHFENGLAARLLLAFPPSTQSEWNEIEVREESISPVRCVFEKLNSLEMSEDSLGNFEPVDLVLSSEAKERWVTFYNEHNEETHNLSHEYLAAAWSKLEGYAARLALIVNCIRSAQEGVNPKCDSSISLDSIKSGISLVSWFKNETKRIYGLMTESENIQDSRKVMNWIEQKGGAATIRDVMRVGLCGANSERLNKAFTTLIQSGIGSWQNVKPKPRGGRGTKLFILTRETDKTDETQC
tara:strand:- start:271 stop:2631 length:2361 start_codon:yes stop_codon:yes gene_type:complete